MLSGCSDEMDFSNVPSGGVADGFTLEIKCSDVQTRATEAGDDSLNENLIRSATVCLWPNGGDWLSSDEPMYMETFTGLDAVGTATLRLPVTEEMANSLFRTDGSRTCRVFVAVNVDPAGARTVDELRALAISSTFDSKMRQDAFAMDGDGEAMMFNVGGSTSVISTVEVARSASKFTLHLKVDEEVKETVGGETLTWVPSLDNMTVSLNNGVKRSTLDPVAKNVKDSDYFQTSPELSYTFEKEDGVSEYPYVQKVPLYSYPNEWEERSNGNDAKGMTHLTLMIPWSSDGGKSFRSCYYRVPVTELSKRETVRNTSYHIRLRVGVLGSFVPDEPMEIENLKYGAVDWGKESLDIDINEVRYLVVDQNDYEVNNEEEIGIQFYSSHPTEVIDATMTFYRFNFSDQGSAFAVKVTSAQNALSKTKTGKAVFTPSFDNKTKMLTVSHPLKVFEPRTSSGAVVDLTNGDMKYGKNDNRDKTQTEASVNAVLNKIAYFVQTTDEEYSKVVFSVTVQHSDMKGTPNFKETVTITQYPGMYITAEQNYVKTGDTNLVYSGGYGSTYINGNYKALSLTNITAPSGYTAQGWTTSIGINSVSFYNWNPNLYLITITRLPDGSTYHIGDPRAEEINNMLSDASMGTQNKTAWTGDKLTNGVTTTGFASAKGIEGGNRKLSYYYPTKETTASQKMLAPKFRICSSYGGTNQILTRALARRRAAAYQEMGYAAGRWRLPTYSEVEFLMQLSADLKIPRLFGVTENTTWWYWSANGAAKVPPKNATNHAIQPSLDGSYGNSTTARARFVYDEWYWGSETLKKISNTASSTPQYEFTWGDRPR